MGFWCAYFVLIESAMATAQCICLALTFPSLFTMLLLLAGVPVFNVSRIISGLGPGSLLLIIKKQVLASPVTQTSDISGKSWYQLWMRKGSIVLSVDDRSMMKSFFFFFLVESLLVSEDSLRLCVQLLP